MGTGDILFYFLLLVDLTGGLHAELVAFHTHIILMVTNGADQTL